MDRREELTTEERDGGEVEPGGESESGEEQEKAPAGTDFFSEALDALRREKEQYHDQLLRKQAEFENYRRRVEKEKADTRFAAKQEILRELLNVLDACEQGLAGMERAEGNLQSYREGYRLLERQVKSLLSKFGVEEIAAAGRQFDPNVHEAVLHEISESHPEGEVIEEVKKGYRLNDRLLRPTQVKVARIKD
jgi:molecular chaperone GrpE